MFFEKNLRRLVARLLDYLSESDFGSSFSELNAQYVSKKKNTPEFILLVHLRGKWKKRGVCPLKQDNGWFPQIFVH